MDYGIVNMVGAIIASMIFGFIIPLGGRWTENTKVMSITVRHNAVLVPMFMLSSVLSNNLLWTMLTVIGAYFGWAAYCILYRVEAPDRKWRLYGPSVAIPLFLVGMAMHMVLLSSATLDNTSQGHWLTLFAVYVLGFLLLYSAWPAVGHIAIGALVQCLALRLLEVTGVVPLDQTVLAVWGVLCATLALLWTLRYRSWRRR